MRLRNLIQRKKAIKKSKKCFYRMRVNEPGPFIRFVYSNNNNNSNNNSSNTTLRPSLLFWSVDMIWSALLIVTRTPTSGFNFTLFKNGQHVDGCCSWKFLGTALVTKEQEGSVVRFPFHAMMVVLDFIRDLSGLAFSRHWLKASRLKNSLREFYVRGAVDAATDQAFTF